MKLALVVNAGELRRGDLIELNNQIFRIVEFHHPGRGLAIVRLKLKNIATGQVIEQTFPSTSGIVLASLEQRVMRFLYLDGDLGYFMDEASYEQVVFDREKVSHVLPFLKEGIEVKVNFYKDQPVGVELPTTVELKVEETAPGFRGDTAAAGTKPAKLETGYTIQVPFFIQAGDIIRIDTRTGEYVERT